MALIQVMEKEKSEPVFNTGIWEVPPNFVLPFLESQVYLIEFISLDLNLGTSNQNLGLIRIMQELFVLVSTASSLCL